MESSIDPAGPDLTAARTFAIATFGCKVNQYESQVLREGLLARGLDEVDPRDGPDLLLVNTCTVTGRAGAESRRYARRAARYAGVHVVVTGCHADSDASDYRETGIDLVAGNAAKGDLLSRLGIGPAPEAPFAETIIRGAGSRTRATVKIQDGCRAGCAYCIIPRVRPVLASKSPDRVVEEVRGLIDRNFREVVLTGIHLGAYGRERGEEDALATLVERLLDETSLPRLRLSSLEATELSPRLLRAFAGQADRLAPHVHLPLQSGAESTLRRMGRRHGVDAFRATIATVRSALPEPAVTTDVIVGFPGETEEEFEETLAFCDEIAFLKIHVFPYSDRPGTRASSLPGKVHGRVIHDRVARLVALSRATGDAFRQRFEHRVVPVLVERRRTSAGRLTGLTDRYVRVDLDGADELMNRIVPVRLEAIEADRTYGRPEP